VAQSLLSNVPAQAVADTAAPTATTANEHEQRTAQGDRCRQAPSKRPARLSAVLGIVDCCWARWLMNPTHKVHVVLLTQLSQQEPLRPRCDDIVVALKGNGREKRVDQSRRL
jgi:hypothetical protein